MASRNNAVLVVALLLVSVAAQADYYRYITDEGQTVVVGQLNSEAIRLGYEQLSDKGQVIKVVERSKSNEEKARLRAEQLRAEQQQAWDKSLLLKYSTVEDIEASAVRALREIDVRLGILRSNRSVLKTQLNSEQAKAADIERRSQQVPEDLQLRIKNLAIELDTTKETIARHQREKLELQSSYKRDAVRFAELKSITELRNTYHQN
ncbi:hypothetical protein EDC56_3338 [Sinobacterium caligoides]|uniref:Uncharacterized protein n=1 Tax=Sinobacterium caligoides TaxID=933926 RepID=A0A3N2DHK9_9GAMM|nr:DUF4124 domain-containing protein [Sinobacterium caligoides]ROR99098.1 hypothetical protein EDC56_3338 [Sinobacterium caligoides]